MTTGKINKLNFRRDTIFRRNFFSESCEHLPVTCYEEDVETRFGELECEFATNAV